MKVAIWTGAGDDLAIDADVHSRILSELKLPTLDEFELAYEQLEPFDERLRGILDRIDRDRIGSEANKRLADELHAIVVYLRMIVYKCWISKKPIRWFTR